ncbi:MAG: bifunctional serine/threonine-protein kinase/formylglycine-generating enzyme family protein [Chlamydiota bacterium]
MNHRELGDYIFLKRLGTGSLGETHLVEHRYLKRLFVLKLLSSEMAADENFTRRFEKEILALSKLEHPHIAKICNASCAEGHYFLVSDAVVDNQNESMNLAQFLQKKSNRLTEEEVLKIARQIASALDYAHSTTIGNEPVSHGCIKLNNIVVKEVNGGIHVFITDFGLTRLLRPAALLNRTYQAVASLLASSTVQRDPEQIIAGPWDLPKASELHRCFCQTFAFLAPEQKVVGHPLASAIKADVYAFGILLYHLLTGEFPEGYFDLPSKNRPDLKWNWDLLICRAMQTDPLKRPDSLSEKIEEMLSATPLSSSKVQPEKVRASAPVAAGAATLQSAKPVLKPQEIARPSFEPDPGAIFQNETTVAPYRPQPKEELEIEPLMTEMAIIPEGTYTRGSNHGGRDEMPKHAIHIHSFAMDTHPVTNEQFVRFLEVMGGEKDCNNNDIIRLRESRVKRFGGKLNIESGYAKHPVVGVTWYGAIAYSKWVGKRLPTEAEWEIAAYGGHDELIYPTGNEIERTQSNFFSSDTTPVMSYTTNGYGLYDMAGNVYEWCQDWYDYHFYDVSVQEPDNPKGPLQGVYRVLRGGCWKSSKEDLRCAHRHRNNPGVMNGTYGFRCAADVATEE